MSEDSDFSAPYGSTGAWQKPETSFPASEESDEEDTSSMDGIDLKVGRRQSDSDPVVDLEQGESSEGSTGGLEPRAGEGREPDVPEADIATLHSSEDAECSRDIRSDVVDDTTHAVETRQALRNEVDPADPSSLLDSSNIGTSSKSDAGCRWRVNDLKNSMLMVDTLDRSGNDRGHHDRGHEADNLTSAAPSHGANSSGGSPGTQQKKKRKPQKAKFPRHTRLR
jgi:hypothetical protein